MTEAQDPRVRALIDELLSAAPPRPPLPDEHAVRSVRRARRAVVLAVAFACVIVLVAGGVGIARRRTHKPRVVIEQPTTTSSSSVPRTTTSVVAAHAVLPTGTAFVGLDHNTGSVYALDANGRVLRTLFGVGVEATHHWPTITQMQLGPDQTTLWYAANPTASAPCSTVTERNLATGATRGRFQGSWIALSPDGTRLAYAGCISQDPTVYITDLRNGDAWTARAPATTAAPGVTPLGYLTWTPDGRDVLAEYLDGAQWKLADLVPTSRPGPVAWGRTVLTFGGEDRLTTTPDALYVSAGTVNNTWSIDTYDWSYHQTSHIPTTLAPLEIVVANGRVYFMGGPATGGSSIDTSLYRVGPNGQSTELRHGIGDVVATSIVTGAAPVDATTALNRYLAAHPTAVVHSSPFASGSAELAVVGVTNGAQNRVITVLSLTTGTATPVATLTLPYPHYDFALDLPVEVADVTGDGRPDVLVRVMAADNQPGVVVSDDGGTWRLVPAAKNVGVYIARNPTFTAGRLTSINNDCVPDCARGRSTTITWRYDRQHRDLTS